VEIKHWATYTRVYQIEGIDKSLALLRISMPIQQFLIRAGIAALAAATPLSLTAGNAIEQNNLLLLERPDDASGASLVLVGPHHLRVQIDFTKDEAVMLDADRIAELELPDGMYTFEALFTREPDDTEAADLAERREAGETDPGSTNVLAPVSGTITIGDGRLIGGEKERDQEEQTESGSRSFVIDDNLIVFGKTCLGLGCASGESPGPETLRLEENNTRISFIDNSSTDGGFPAGDWQLRANDSEMGGADHFSIDWLGTSASTGGSSPISTPFRVDAAAPSNALRISPQGLIGLGTATPALNLHITSGNTPAHRLQQTASGPFPAQTWDIAGNEVNFFIRDLTSGSLLPFRIRPGAPTSSIDISASGNVGIGTATPEAKLHISDGDLRVDGAIYHLSSRALKTDFVRFDPALLLERLSRLDLGFWNYLDRPSERFHFGPAAEDFSNLFELGKDADSISLSDMAGVALGAAQALAKQLDKRDARIESLEGEIDQLNARLQQLENLIHAQSAGSDQ